VTGPPPATHGAGRADGGDDGPVTIRPLTEYAELRRCVELQQRIWGPEFGELVPPAILWVAGHIGGVVAGAFDDDGRMLGFVFGLTGCRDGEPFHWSDMLAVDETARGRGLARKLKRYQRETLLHRDVTRVGWTFDPLESRNAFLNFARLGVTARRYVRDCYGQSASPLHHDLGTDRLIADWRLASPRVRLRMDRGDPPPVAPDVAGLEVVNPGGAEPRLDLEADALRLHIPADVQALKARDPAAVRHWRLTTRLAFETYLARGYEVLEFVRDTAAVGSYVLARADTADPS
jgi:chorismate synthase